MIEDEADRGRVEPGVDGVEHRARHRYAVMDFQHVRHVGRHHGDRVAKAEPAFGEGRGEPAAARVKFGVIAPEAPVDHCRFFRIDLRRALQKGQRRERLVVGGLPVEAGFIRVRCHGHSSGAGEGLLATLLTACRGGKHPTAIFAGLVRPCQNRRCHPGT